MMSVHVHQMFLKVVGSREQFQTGRAAELGRYRQVMCRGQVAVQLLIVVERGRALGAAGQRWLRFSTAPSPSANPTGRRRSSGHRFPGCPTTLGLNRVGSDRCRFDGIPSTGASAVDAAATASRRLRRLKPRFYEIAIIDDVLNFPANENVQFSSAILFTKSAIENLQRFDVGQFPAFM